jgi:Na+/H+-translocating membrane pyrophosphatase
MTHSTKLHERKSIRVLLTFPVLFFITVPMVLGLIMGIDMIYGSILTVIMSGIVYAMCWIGYIEPRQKEKSATELIKP